MQQTEHIGIAVKSLERSVPLFEQLSNTPCYKVGEVTTEGVNTAFCQVGETKVELLEATKADSPIAKFVEKKGEGIHHLAFAVDNIEAEMKRLAALGFELLSERPKRGADNKLVCFLHPKSTNGVLIELCQSLPGPSPSATRVPLPGTHQGEGDVSQGDASGGVSGADKGFIY